MKTTLKSKNLLAAALLFLGCGVLFSSGTTPLQNSIIAVAHAADDRYEDQLERIADRYEDQLHRDSILGKYKLEADEDDGHIELEGRVRTQIEKDRAYRIARAQTPKRSRVINKIKVRP